MKIVIVMMKLLIGVIVLSLLACSLYFFIMEGYAYIYRSEDKAQEAAEAIFYKICKNNNLDPRSFHGPERPSIELDKKRDQYSFIWTRRVNETIYVNVSYLPYDFASSVSEALVERKKSSESFP
ncbi:hypothetical protein [Telmatospirillum siberiense]|uniref:Uncharacterized protein n=1 Tax=Telmatospirillum siberiense TaxID=382514 RepID=A0A2N3PM93_9PROT|nr:hypothetical protein [Telmatospirillum siberiense]PKU21514.1 hypothetical protein CWS72_26285 [Telmatospirillum siberiense]